MWPVKGVHKTANGNIIFNGYVNDSNSDSEANSLKRLPDVYEGNLKFTREVSPQGKLLWSNKLFTSGYNLNSLKTVGSTRSSSGSNGLTGEESLNNKNYLSIYTSPNGKKSIADQSIHSLYAGDDSLTAIYSENGKKVSIFPGISIIDSNESNYLSRSGLIVKSDGTPKHFIERESSGRYSNPKELTNQNYYDTYLLRYDDGSHTKLLRKSEL